ncbi:MAG TPA: tetratricopeptide repeat protein [Planctomycetota bacterium]|nr:tetratricopeptide repeat protein [Planctomycetota bacterium]
MIFSGEICVYCGRPITLDDNNPQVARCRKCSAPHHTQCWFASNEKCTVAGCDGKASDIGPPKLREPVGEVCPFLPPETPRKEGAEAVPAKCLRTRCMLYDGIEKRCALGEIAYTLATVRQSGRETRHLLNQAVGSSSKQTVQLLTTLSQSFRNAEGNLKALLPPQERNTKTLEASVLVLGEIKAALEALSGDQQAAAEGFDRLARAVEASGTGEQVRHRRDARLAARAALRDGRPGAAVSLLLQAQRRAPDNAVANDLATAYVASGRLKEAIELLEKVLAESPDYTPCRITLASLKLKGGEPQAAEELLRDAPQPPDFVLRAELAYAKACAAYAVGRSEDAVDLLNKALDEDPWHTAAAAALQDLRARRTGTPVPEAATLALEAAGVEARHG